MMVKRPFRASAPLVIVAALSAALAIASWVAYYNRGGWPWLGISVAWTLSALLNTIRLLRRADEQEIAAEVKELKIADADEARREAALREREGF